MDKGFERQAKTVLSYTERVVNFFFEEEELTVSTVEKRVLDIAKADVVQMIFQNRFQKPEYSVAACSCTEQSSFACERTTTRSPSQPNRHEQHACPVNPHAWACMCSSRSTCHRFHVRYICEEKDSFATVFMIAV